MGKTSKRRKELAALERKAKREKRERALKSLAAFSMSSAKLEQLERGMMRTKKDRENLGIGQQPTEEEESPVEKMKVQKVMANDVCGLESLIPVANVRDPKAQKNVGKTAKSVNSSAISSQTLNERVQTSKQASVSSTNSGLKSNASLKVGEHVQEKFKPIERSTREGQHTLLMKTESINMDKADNKSGTEAPIEIAENVKRPHFVVHVQRKEDIQEIRQSLPICGMEQEIMEAINENSMVLLCGETGCGKTTQVPQFLYEAGYGTGRTKGCICVTQPRRIAASSTAERVAVELDCELGGIVGYQVRYVRRDSEKSVVRFVTDGILMRELQEDALLRKYSVIVLDEVHERNLNTDVILGFLTRIIPLRDSLSAQSTSGIEPLKLIIMSATLSATEFAENRKLFRKPPPILNVPAKRFPVTIHFSRRTELHSYLNAAYRKVSAIHRKLPNGGILVFVTGQREVMYLVNRIRKQLCRDKHNGKSPDEDQGMEENTSAHPFDGDAAEDFSSEDDEGEMIDEDSLSESDEEEEDVVQMDASEKLDQNAGKHVDDDMVGNLNAVVVPLYAKLSAQQQAKAFVKPPEGCRLIVVSTNVAETSITIPGIKYVVDTGRSKQKTSKSVSSGLVQFEIDWISKSSATQRAGRAGRTGPGHCYRLYSSAHFNDNFPEYSIPDIHNTPLESVILQLKSIGVDKPAGFPFPSSPDHTALKKAEMCLSLLGAIHTESGQITILGKYLSKFPINPRHGRMVLAAVRLADSTKTAGKCLQMAISIAAILSFENPVARQDIQNHANTGGSKKSNLFSKEEHDSIAQRYGGEVFATAAILRAYEEQCQNNSAQLYTFCAENNLHVTIMKEIVQLKNQLAKICASSLAHGKEFERLPEYFAMKAAIGSVGGKSGLSGITPVPNAKLANVIQHAISIGWADRIARKVHFKELSEEQKQAIASVRGGRRRYQTLFGNEFVYLRKRSPFSRNNADFVVYLDLIQGEKYINMECVTEVHESWLSETLKPLCVFSAPLDDPEPFYNFDDDEVYCYAYPSIGKYDWTLPMTKVKATDKSVRAKAFLMALLSGKVFPELVQIQGIFIPIPNIQALGTAQHPGLIMALHCLEKYNVSSRKGFTKALCLKNGFMTDELSKCTKKDKRQIFKDAWGKFCHSFTLSKA